MPLCNSQLYSPKRDSAISVSNFDISSHIWNCSSHFFKISIDFKCIDEQQQQTHIRLQHASSNIIKYWTSWYNVQSANWRTLNRQNLYFLSAFSNIFKFDAYMLTKNGGRSREVHKQSQNYLFRIYRLNRKFKIEKMHKKHLNCEKNS